MRDKFEELQIDLEVLKHEKEMMMFSENPKQDSAQIVKITLQNERLKEALLRLRDICTEQEKELRSRSNIVDVGESKLEECMNQNKKLKQELEKAENVIEELKISLDDALGAEELIHQLTDKNLNLSEKLEEMKSVIEDLETLKEIGDELEESHLDTEKQLLIEIDMRDTIISELKTRFFNAEETMVDYERTILKFRDLVKSLENDVLEYREKLGGDETRDYSREKLELEEKVKVSEKKLDSLQVEIALKDVDLRMTKMHLNAIRQYIPKDLIESDEKAIGAVLSMKTIYEKDRIIDDFYARNESSSLDMESIIKIGNRLQIREHILKISIIAQKFESSFNYLSGDDFLRIGMLQNDSSFVEQHLDRVIGFMKENESNTEIIGDMERCASKFTDLYSSFVENSSDPANASLSMKISCEETHLLLEKIEYEIERLHLVFDATSYGFSDTHVDMNQSWVQDLVKSLSDASQELINPNFRKKIGVLKTHVSKILDKINGFKSAALDDSDLHTRIEKVKDTLSNIVCVVLRTRNEIETFVRTHVDTKQSFTANMILDLSRKASETGFGVQGKSHMTVVDELIDHMISEFMNVTESLMSMKFEPENNADPLLIRARLKQAEWSQNLSLPKEYESLNEETQRILKEVKLKDQTIEELNLKIAILEKKIENVKHHVDTITKLEEQLQKSKQSAKMYEEAVESLHADLEALEKENENLKTKMKKKISRQEPTDEKSRESSVKHESERDEQVVHRYKLEQMRNIVRILRKENVRLKNSKIRDQMYDLISDQQSMMKLDEKLSYHSMEKKIVLESIHETLSMPLIVDLSTVGSEIQHKWKSKIDSPQMQYSVNKIKLMKLQQRYEDITCLVAAQ